VTACCQAGVPQEACPCHDPVVLGHLRLTCPRTAVAAVPLESEPEGAVWWANTPVSPLTVQTWGRR
jgi:hypothetical protein